MTSLPFLTAYDPPGTSEGSLDPLGLYQIADRLATELVPAVRERMQRIRCLTAMAVGALITQDFERQIEERDADPCFVWEWLVVEALVREMGDDASVWGVPGTQVARRAVEQRGYLDARSYLKTPRIFGFHGVYKRLAVHLGIINVNLAPSRNTESLVDAWKRDIGVARAESLMKRWTAAVNRCLSEKPPRTRPSWSRDAWRELAEAFTPASMKRHEKKYLRDVLLSGDGRPMGALPAIWQLQTEFSGTELDEQELHRRLAASAPRYVPTIRAIRAYESFARTLQDAFEVLRTTAAHSGPSGFSITALAQVAEFRKTVKGLHRRFEIAHRALGDVSSPGLAVQNMFADRFRTFAEPMEPAAYAMALCAHHEEIQRRKSAEGKRSWFDRIGPERIFLRHAYRQNLLEIQPGTYVHPYRGRPIHRFYRDLS